jgi:ferric-dicitrate binding protein FerR (iron transport regulator)
VNTAHLNDEAMNWGLLMESAQAHQRLAEENLDRLKAHTQDLDGLVREEIRRTLIEELQAVTAESKLAAEALRVMRRTVSMRGALWSVGMWALCAGVPGAIAWWALPSQAQIAALRAQRDELVLNVTRLEQRGGRIDWRRCGDTQRLCVRVERKGPAYGDNSDYLVVKGY